MSPALSCRRARPLALSVLLTALVPALFCSSPARAAPPPAPAVSAAPAAPVDRAGLLADHPGFGSGSPRSLLLRQLGRLPLAPRVTTRRALAVITDFADSRLEDWSGDGFNNEAEVRHTLDEMAAHWEWLSHNRERMQWDIIRVTLPANLTPTAYASWPDFREAVAAQIRAQVDVGTYDANHDGVIDSAWVVASSKDREYDYLIGGTSSNGGVNLFVDGQADLSVRVDAYGNFNHELGHTLGLPDLYGPYDTVHYLTLMSDSWPVPPNDFTAYERSLLGWVTPRALGPGRHRVRLRNASEHFDAVRINTGRPNEYFLIEYRQRPGSGFGSQAPFYDGLAVYHVLENSTQWIDPPLLKLVPADGAIAPDEAPQFTDFFYPGNPGQRLPVTLRSYFAGVPVARLDNVRWDGKDLRLDVAVLPPLAPALGPLVLQNRLQNPSFEDGYPLPDAWSPEAFLGTSLFELDTPGLRSPRRATIDSPTPNDARWIQTVGGLAPGQAYEFCGSLKGEDIVTTPTAQVGANVSVMGGFTRSRSLAGNFNWTRACVVHQPVGSSDTFACRLGFYGSTVTGRLSCDRLTLYPLQSAFTPVPD